jgi:hypothetical protein
MSLNMWARPGRAQCPSPRACCAPTPCLCLRGAGSGRGALQLPHGTHVAQVQGVERHRGHKVEVEGPNLGVTHTRAHIPQDSNNDCAYNFWANTSRGRQIQFWPLQRALPASTNLNLVTFVVAGVGGCDRCVEVPGGTRPKVGVLGGVCNTCWAHVTPGQQQGARRLSSREDATQQAVCQATKYVVRTSHRGLRLGSRPPPLVPQFHLIDVSPGGLPHRRPRLLLLQSALARQLCTLLSSLQARSQFPGQQHPSTTVEHN